MMSVAVRYKNKILLLCKGADSALLEKSDNSSLSEIFKNKVKNLEDEGYRLFFIGVRLISELEY